MDRYLAPPLQRLWQNVKEAKKTHKEAKAVHLIAKKIKKYEGARLRKQRVQLRADKKRVRAFARTFLTEARKFRDLGGADRVSTLRKLLNDAVTLEQYDSPGNIGCRIWRIKLGLDELEFGVREADGELNRVTTRLNECMKQSYQSQEVNTTIQNAQSVQRVADYFYAREAEGGLAFGAGQVFEQVLRPWCTAAIHPPPPMVKWRLAESCVECHETDCSWRLLRDCELCKALVCGHCDHRRHCPVMEDIRERKREKKERAHKARAELLAKKMARRQPNHGDGVLALRPHYTNLYVAPSVLDADDDDASDSDTYSDSDDSDVDQDSDEEDDDDSSLAKFVADSDDDSGSDGEFVPSDSEDDDDSVSMPSPINWDSDD